MKIVCPSIKGYAYPPRSGASCRSSLEKSTESFVVIPEPSGLRAAAEKAADRGAKCDPPLWVAEKIPTFYDVASAGFEMNEDANAGFPYCLEGLKKLPWVRENMQEFVVAVQLRMAALAVVEIETLEQMSAVDLVRGGFVDPTAVIEKNEPTKESKLAEGRPRNVICGSVVDEAIDRLIFGKINKAQIAEWGDVPSCIGLGFTDEKVKEIDLAIMYLSFESRGRNLRSSDVKGFEFSIQKWGFKGDWIRRCRAMGVPEDSYYAKMMWKRMICIMRSVYVFTDGIMYAQKVDGWQKSGEINTSSTNTAVREIDAYLIGAEAVRAAGDDCVETEVEDAEAKYRAIGITIKSYDLASPEDYEFCSHRFRTGHKPEPLNAPKSFYKLCCEEPTEEKIRQVVEQFLYAKEMKDFSLAFSRFYRPSDKNKQERKESSVEND